ncbi:jg10927 [Pararge aegeria aegeria]|uniref:Jg10927 protein n=1 Tax=Pararge aegeria aegeria TaxID=348720 RepID=A0A8S4SKX7_9NEOP|nr:jg10927 [Pararge aegeria aegeria]
MQQTYFGGALPQTCDKRRRSVWFAKTKLKGTSVTLAEFLIKSRHKTFLAARQRFGLAKVLDQGWQNCGALLGWTTNGSHAVCCPTVINAGEERGPQLVD